MLADGGLALNSPLFFGFTAIVLLAFFAVPARLRWLVVVAASYAFYATWEALPALVGLLALTTAVHLSAVAIARFPRHRRWSCAAGLLASLGSLVALKYADVIAAQAHAVGVTLGIASAEATVTTSGWFLPVGFSFVTFSLASYVIDVYRGAMAPARFLDLAAYTAFYPKLLAGPIERAKDLLPQWHRARPFDPVQATEGFQIVLWGLVKKVVIADRLAVFVNDAFAAPGVATPPELVVAVYFYAFQIYCDFSGYSDIAIGTFKLFGFDLAENFRRPYFSRSIGEPWSKRWHVTLGTWFRDYLYIPLGGNRVPKWRVVANVMIVFLVSGLWHAGFVGAAGIGWTFLAWGAINGAYQSISLATAPLWKRLGERAPLLRRLAGARGIGILQALGVFHLVGFSWIFFRAHSLADAWTVITRIGVSVLELPALFRYFDGSFDFVVALALIVLLVGVEALHERRSMVERLRAWPTALRWGYYYLLGLALVVFGAWGGGDFIYMQF